MNGVQDKEITLLVPQEMVDAMDNFPADIAHELFKEIIPEITCSHEMVNATDGIPADIAHELFERIVPEITLFVLQEIAFLSILVT